jgi:hypothetical protein
MKNTEKSAPTPRAEWTASVRTGRVLNDRYTRASAAKRAYRARIESLLNESKDERLAAVWQRVCPFPIESAHDLPDRRGIIKDLADFAEVLQPSLDDMEAHRLCHLVEKYGACESRPLDLPLSSVAGQARLRNHPISSRCHGAVATLHE